MWKLFSRGKGKQSEATPQTDVQYRELEIDGEVYCVGRMRLNAPISPVPLEESEFKVVRLTDEDK